MPLEDTTPYSFSASRATAEHLSPNELSWVLTLNVDTCDLSEPAATFLTTTHISKARKLQERMLSNRVAAHNSRKRKKEKAETLEETVKKLQEINKELLEQVRTATLENDMLKANLRCMGVQH